MNLSTLEGSLGKIAVRLRRAGSLYLFQHTGTGAQSRRGEQEATGRARCRCDELHVDGEGGGD